MKTDNVFNVFWDRLQFNTVRAAFNLAIAEHDKEIVDRVKEDIQKREQMRDSPYFDSEDEAVIIELTELKQWIEGGSQ